MQTSFCFISSYSNAVCYDREVLEASRNTFCIAVQPLVVQYGMVVVYISSTKPLTALASKKPFTSVYLNESAHAVVKFKQHVWHACPNLRWRKDNGILFVSWSSNMSDVQLVGKWSINSYCKYVKSATCDFDSSHLNGVSCDILWLFIAVSKARNSGMLGFHSSSVLALQTDQSSDSGETWHLVLTHNWKLKTTMYVMVDLMVVSIEQMSMPLRL